MYSHVDSHVTFCLCNCRAAAIALTVVVQKGECAIYVARLICFMCRLRETRRLASTCSSNPVNLVVLSIGRLLLNSLLYCWEHFLCAYFVSLNQKLGRITILLGHIWILNVIKFLSFASFSSFIRKRVFTLRALFCII